MAPGRAPFPAWLAASLLLSACAEPPNTEIDRAQGAIDAARAAGAEQYATAEYAEATGALKNANDAVAAGDYRLALNYALESHEHAQNAARDTANTKARMRADIERAVAGIGALVEQGKMRVAAAGRAGVRRRLLTQPTAELERAAGSLQKAGEAVAAGDYLAAEAALEGVQARVDKAIAALDNALASVPARRRR